MAMTREQIEQTRSGLLSGDRFSGTRINALCDLALRSLQPVAQGWISVDERLPEKEGEHLCAYRHKQLSGLWCMDVVRYSEAFGEFSLFRGQAFTHWRPIPPPPGASVPAQEPLSDERRLANEKAQREAWAGQNAAKWWRQQMADAQNVYGSQRAHQQASHAGLANSALYWLDPVGGRGR